MAFGEEVTSRTGWLGRRIEMDQAILIIEDDDNDAFFLTDALTNAGVENPLRVVKDGQQGIDYFKGEGKFANRAEYPLPYLVLLDLKLPRVSGLDVLSWIRSQPGPGPIVIPLSSSENESDITAAYQSGANGFLVKPNGIEKYLEMATALKEFWLVLNRPAPPRKMPKVLC